MPQIRMELIAILLLVVSTVLSAPHNIDYDLKVNVSTSAEMPNTRDYENDSAALTTDASTVTSSLNGPRTLIMYGLMSWLFGVVKAMIKPARNMYIMMAPEISAFRCLSESREFQNVMGFSGSDVEGYVYETPRTSGRGRPDADKQDPSGRGFSDDLYEIRQIVHPSANPPENTYYDPPEYSVSQATQHRTDEVLKRIPRFIDEFASLLKEGQAMNCIMPYMRERVSRWLDS